MSVRSTNAHACAFFMLVCSHTNVVLAEEPNKKEATTPNPEQDESRSKPALVIEYSSVFDNYVPFDDMPDIGWKEANDNVGQIGGWRAYAKLVQEEARKKAESEAQNQGGDQK